MGKRDNAIRVRLDMSVGHQRLGAQAERAECLRLLDEKRGVYEPYENVDPAARETFYQPPGYNVWWRKEWHFRVWRELTFLESVINANPPGGDATNATT